MSFAQQVKNNLLEIISDMAEHPEDFSKHPESDFSRNRKLNFSALLHLIISMEAGTVKDELLKFFSYDKNTVSNSAFFQQKAKMAAHLLLLPEILRSRILILLRMERLQMATIRFMSSRSLTFFPRCIQTVWCSPSERKTSSGHFVL